MSTAPPPGPSVSNSRPSAVSNGNAFYTFYQLSSGSTNELCVTTFDGSKWFSNTLTGSGGVGNLSPQANSVVHSILVGSVVCVVFQANSNSLVVLCNDGTNWAQRTTYVGGNTINNFCLYTDGTYLYMVTNESGTLYTNRLNNSTFDQKTKVNGQSHPALATNAPAAATNSSLSAGYYAPGYLHIAYTTSFQGNVTYDVYQATATTWSYTAINSDAQGVALSVNFFNFNGNFYAALCDDFGFINVYQFINGQALPWSRVFQSPQDFSQSAEGTISVGVVNGGVFISYRASDNSLRILYSFDAATWYFANMTGGITPVLTGQPSMNSSPSVAIWNNFVYHAIYVTNDNRVYDVFWAWGWNGAELYPKQPGATTQMTSLETKADVKMF